MVVAERHGALVGAAPLVVQHRAGARIARFVGAHESALGDLLLAPSEGVRTAKAMLDTAIAGAKPHAFDVFGLPSNSNLAGTSISTSFGSSAESNQFLHIGLHSSLIFARSSTIRARPSGPRNRKPA